NKLQNSELFELNEVFRYTPEIANFVKDLDAAFPAVSVGDDWGAYVGESNLENGDKPVLRVYDTQSKMIGSVFDEALKIAGRKTSRAGSVAVLNLSHEMHRTYRKTIERWQNRIVNIDGRSTGQVRHKLRNKVVYSLPEYVAGMQFDLVYLLHVDKATIPPDLPAHLNRGMISLAYLGATRARTSLRICVTQDDGGPSPILELPLMRNSLVTAD
ncbi:MAG: hypothetical protein AAF926_03795, partial [Pseudomonadota bacterium]